LVSPAVVDARIAGGPVFHERWPGLLAPQDEADTTTIITQAGEGLAVHTATLTNVLPGVHIVALATT
jgi:hypothetical protein